MKKVFQFALGLGVALLAAQTVAATAETRSADDSTIYNSRQKVAGTRYYTTHMSSRMNDAQFGYERVHVMPVYDGGSQPATQFLSYPAARASVTLVCTVIDPKHSQTDSCEVVRSTMATPVTIDQTSATPRAQ